MSKKVTDLPAATVLNDADDFLISQAGVSKKLPASLVGGAAGPYGTLAFEWNKTDVSQFAASPTFRVATGGVAGALSVFATAEHGNVLRYTGGAGAGTGVTEVFLANDALIFDGTKRDMMIETVMFDDGAVATSTFGGVAFLCNDAADHGYAQCASVHTNNRNLCINNGVIESTASGAGSSADLIAQYDLHATKPAGAPPFATVIMRGTNKTQDAENVKRTGSSAAARAFMSDMGDNSVLGATWNAEALDRWGICMHSDTGGVTPATADFLSIRVFVK